MITKRTEGGRAMAKEVKANKAKLLPPKKKNSKPPHPNKLTDEDECNDHKHKDQEHGHLPYRSIPRQATRTGSEQEAWERVQEQHTHTLKTHACTRSDTCAYNHKHATHAQTKTHAAHSHKHKHAHERKTRTRTQNTCKLEKRGAKRVLTRAFCQHIFRLSLREEL